MPIDKPAILVPMKLTLHSDDRAAMKAEVADNDEWVSNAIEAAWQWLRYTGAGSVTVKNEKDWIATVMLEINDE